MPSRRTKVTDGSAARAGRSCAGERSSRYVRTTSTRGLTARRAERRRSVRLELFAMARGLGAIAARGHVAPAAASVLRVVEEDALASLIRAAPDARELAEDERVGGGLDDRDHEARERVTDRDE